MPYADSRPLVVLGGGSWGTALAHLLAVAVNPAGQPSPRPVHLIVREHSVASAINATQRNPRYLTGETLHPALCATSETEVLKGAGLVVLAVPCQSLRGVLGNPVLRFAPDVVLVNAAKGLEVGSGATPGRIVAEMWPQLADRYAVLSGPSFALETVRGKPTAVVLGCADEELGARLRDLFATEHFRTYSSTDVVGVELGGAVKNVIAIAAGISDGLGFGHNARAALITRGLAEISRFGLSFGARPSTFMGLSGLGDLMLTCAGDLSRNRQVGLRLGQGESLEAITASLNAVAEGVKTTEAVKRLAEERAVDMPVTQAVYEVLREGLPPARAVQQLMRRQLREE